MKAFFLVAILSITLCSAQAPKLVGETPLAVHTYVGTDTYKNLYYIKDMAFYKEGPDGNYVFKDFSLGPLSQIDLINPLKILLFYEQTNTVVFIDNRLNEVERINFNNLPRFVNIVSVGNAGNNRVWLFNSDTQQLELYDYRQQRALQTSLPMEGKPMSMASNFNYCYLLFKDKLLTFNVYGSFLSEIEISGASNVVQKDEDVFIVKENLLYEYAEPGVHSTDKPVQVKNVPLPEITIKQLHLTQDFLYIYDGKTLRQFAINPPKN
ncbi:MAG: hypothetical protein R3359_13325 [Marinirhabdus sp.]|nr:hypothetical protein [Marinirhabdus sp.]